MFVLAQRHLNHLLVWQRLDRLQKNQRKLFSFQNRIEINMDSYHFHGRLILLLRIVNIIQ